MVDKRIFYRFDMSKKIIMYKQFVLEFVRPLRKAFAKSNRTKSPGVFAVELEPFDGRLFLYCEEDFLEEVSDSNREFYYSLMNEFLFSRDSGPVSEILPPSVYDQIQEGNVLPTRYIIFDNTVVVREKTFFIALGVGAVGLAVYFLIF